MRSCRIVSLAAVVLIAAAITPPESARAESPQFAAATSPPLSIDSAVLTVPSFDSLRFMRVELRAIDSVHVASVAVRQAVASSSAFTLSVAETVQSLEPRSSSARNARHVAHVTSHLRSRLHRTHRSSLLLTRLL